MSVHFFCSEVCSGYISEKSANKFNIARILALGRVGTENNQRLSTERHFVNFRILQSFTFSKIRCLSL